MVVGSRPMQEIEPVAMLSPRGTCEEFSCFSVYDWNRVLIFSSLARCIETLLYLGHQI